MFGLGLGEIIVIVVVALLVLGPDKLPDAAKTLSKGIRDFRKQARDLQRSLEDDDDIGGAIRDIKSALRGDDLPPYVPPHIAEQPGAADPEHDPKPDPARDPDAHFEPNDAEASDAETSDAGPKALEPQPDALEPTPAAGPGTDEPLIRPAEGAVSRTRKVRAQPAPPDESHG